MWKWRLKIMLLARGRYLSGTSNDEIKIASKNFEKSQMQEYIQLKFW